MLSIACNKLTRNNVEKLLSPTVIINIDGTSIEVENTTSSNDIQLYIELSKRQDCLGNIEYVEYKEFMSILGCSKATFYNSLYRLEKLGYIRAVSDRKGYWNITILNNIFLTKEDYKQSYMRTNVDFLYSDEFKKMSWVEKKICLYLHLNKNVNRKLEIYIENLAKAVGIKINSVIKAALDAIKKFFPYVTTMGAQGTKIVFECSNISKNEETEDANYIKHKLKAFCKRNKVNHSDKDVEDISIISGQYSGRLTLNEFMRVVIHVIFKSTKDKTLNPSYINYLCGIESKRKNIKQEK